MFKPVLSKAALAGFWHIAARAATLNSCYNCGIFMMGYLVLSAVVENLTQRMRTTFPIFPEDYLEHSDLRRSSKVIFWEVK